MQHGVPVLIFFFGGGWNMGGEDVPYQIPTQWVDRTPDHIVVSFNYRECPSELQYAWDANHVFQRPKSLQKPALSPVER